MPEDTLQDWLRGKLQMLVGEYRKGLGYGDIFESQFLCYLECLLAARGADPTPMWDAWKDRIREYAHIPEGEPVLAMNRQIGDRPRLIEELEAFQRQLVDGPSPRTVLRVEDQRSAETVAPPEVPPKLGTGRPEKPKKSRGRKLTTDQDVFGLFGE